MFTTKGSIFNEICICDVHDIMLLYTIMQQIDSMNSIFSKLFYSNLLNELFYIIWYALTQIHILIWIDLSSSLLTLPHLSIKVYLTKIYKNSTNLPACGNLLLGSYCSIEKRTFWVILYHIVKHYLKH